MNYLSKLRQDFPELKDVPDRTLIENLDRFEPSIFAGLSFDEKAELAIQDNWLAADMGRSAWAGVKRVGGNIVRGVEQTLGTGNSTSDSIYASADRTEERIDPLDRLRTQTVGFQEDSENSLVGLTHAAVGSAGSMAYLAPTALLGPLAPLGASGLGGLMLGGGSAKETEDQLRQIPDEQLAQAPAFQSYLVRAEKYASEVDDVFALARAQFEKDLIDRNFRDMTTVGGVSMGVLGPLAGKVIRGGTGAISGAGKGFATESAQEFFESGTESYAGQRAIAEATGGEIDREIVLRDALFGAALGGATGGVIGAGTGALMPTPVTSAEATVEEAGRIVAEQGGDALSQEAAKAQVHSQVMPSAVIAEQNTQPTPDYSALDIPSVNRERNVTRGYDGLDGLITLADRMGFTDEVAQLTTAKRLFQQADQARSDGKDDLASMYVRRGNDLYRRATETNDTIREQAANFPVPYVFDGQVDGGQLTPFTQPSQTSNVFDQQPDPAQLNGTRGLLNDAGVIYGQEPSEVTTARQQRQADNFSAFYGQEGTAQFRSDVVAGELDRSSELPPAPERSALPPGTGQIDLGRDRSERTFTPISSEYPGVGRNIIERQSQAAPALPQGNTARSITQAQMIDLQDQYRQAIRVPVRDRTPEQKQAVEMVKAVRSGTIQIDDSRVSQSITGQPINQEWTAFSDESGTLKVPRAEMPQVKAEHRGALVNFLSARGVEHAQAEADPLSLKPTQAEFSPSKVQRAREYQGGERSILISSDGHVVDGHHQWMAKRDLGEPIKVIQFAAPITDLVPLIKEFPSSNQDGGAQNTDVSSQVEQSQQTGTEAAEQTESNTSQSPVKQAAETAQAEQAAESGIATFSRTKGADSALSRDQVEAIATRITADWSNAPEMITVASDLNLPADLQSAIEAQNARGKIDGVFHKGKFYLVADKIRTEADVERIVLHEALGHYGLRQLYGPALGMHMDRLFNRVGGYKGIQRLGKKYGFDLSSYWENPGDMSIAQRREMMADELVAHIAGTGTVEPDLIQQIAHLIREGLRKMMAGTRFADRLNQMTDVEVLRIVAAARQAVTKGESRITMLTHDPRFVREFEKVVYGEKSLADDARFSRTDKTAIGYEQRIDDLFAGAPSNRKGIKVLDRADVLDLLGHGDKPLHLAESAVRKKENGTVKHKMTAADWKRVPSWIENPVAVFRSQTSPNRLVLFAPDLVDGRPVRVILQPNSTLGQMDVHLTINAYEEGGQHITPVDKWVKNGDLLYLDQEKSPAFSERSGLRLPRDVRQLRGYPRIVVTESELVKYREENPDTRFSRVADDNYDHSIERKTGSNAHLISKKGALEPAEANDTASNLSIASESESSTVAVPLSNEDLRAGIRAILPDFKDGDNRATIVNSFDGLPDVVKQEAKNQGSNGDDVEGVFHNGTIYVVADKITSVGQLETLLFHEGTHGGVNALYADEGVSRAMNRLYAAMGGSTGFNKVVDQLGIRNKIEPYIKGTLQREADGRVAMSRELRNTILMQEVLAYTGEKGSKSFQLRLRELVGAVRNWLREHGFLNLAELGVTDIAYIAKQAREQGLKQASDGGVTLFRFGDSVRNTFTSPEPDLTQGGFGIPTERMTDVIVRKFQDKFKVLRDVQAGIRKQGRTIAEDADAYMAEELFHGKTKEDLDVITDTMVKPFAQLLSKHKIDQADIDLYLMAKHAEERNAHIASINPDMPDGGSGLTNAQARQILSDVAASGKQAQYDEIAQVVYDMLANRRTILTESGLLDQSEVDAWESKYQHYVPLKGWAANETQDGRPRTGKGLSIGGKETKRALGRTSQAASPSTYAIHDLTESIVRKRKNEVGNAFLNLVEQNPSKDYWQVFTDDNPETSRTIRKRQDENGNTVEEVVEQAIPMAMMSDRYFTTKKDGKTYYIKLEDQRLLNAMNNVGPEASNALTRTMGAVTRFMSAMNTSYNPEFVVGNFARDVQTAILNLTAEQSRAGGKVEGEQIAAKTVKDIPKAMRAVYRGLRGKKATNPEWQQWYDEFRKAGAQTGYYDMKDIDGQMKDVERLVQIADGGFIGGFHKWRKAGAKLVEDMNGAVENAVRLSAYVNARKAGISQAQAASLAKNMTVNFNRRGEMGTMMNSLYMFFNASVQGISNFGRTMFGLKGNREDPVWKRLTTAQKLAVGIAMGAYALAYANRMAAGEDDDGVNWYDKVPDYVRERNLVFMKSVFGGPQDGSYWKIPLPYGYNIFAIFGENIQAFLSGNRSIGKTSTELAMGVMGSFNPIGFVDSNSLTAGVLRNITPSIGKPIADLVANENFMGTSIYNENFPFGTPKPESQLSRRSTPASYKAIAEWLNEVSGGSKWRSGHIDINPDAMRYMVDYFTGGAGAFFTNKAPDYATRLATGVEVEPHRVPFLSRINGRVMPYEDQSQFYNRRDEINQVNEEFKALTGRERIEFYRDNQDKLALRPMIRTTENQLKALRGRRDAIQANESYSAKERDQRLKEIEALMKASVDRFNRQYNAL